MFYFFIPSNSEKRIETDDGWLKNDRLVSFEEDFNCVWVPENNEEVVVDTKKENAKRHNNK